MPLLPELKRWAERLRAETFALYLAARHPETPWVVRLIVAAIVAYAFSPVDLIPDFIPILGYLDDLILIPIGIYFAIKMVPSQVLAECRARVRAEALSGKPAPGLVAGLVIGFIWLVSVTLLIRVAMTS